MKTVRLEKIPDYAFNFLNLSAMRDFAFFKTVVASPGVMIDFDSEGEPAAIEIIHASRKFGVHRGPCMEGKITGSIIITHDFIHVKLNLDYEKLSKTYDREIPNVYGLRPGEYEIDVV
jgi:hypothetical protein